jgi:hypothetical protein
MEEARLPTSVSLSAAKRYRGIRNRKHDAPGAAHEPGYKPSGLQSAHGQVKRQMELLLILVAPQLGPERVEALADSFAAKALPSRQRAILAAREQREETMT